MSDRFEFAWERAAMRGDELPDRLTLVDQMAYTAMRNIYQAYERRYITREAAAAEKQKVRMAYERSEAEERHQRELAFFQAERTKAVEGAVCHCRKAPTPENALFLCDVLDGLVR